MSRRLAGVGSAIPVLALTALACTGCAFKVVQPPPLVIGSAETGELRVVKYPAYVQVHDAEFFWDAHQIKDNLMGLTELDVVHGIDLLVTLSPDRHPVENGVEWIQNRYAQLPDCAPVRIVGGLFAALEIEKLPLLSSAEIDADPGNPASYFFFTRLIYLSEWVHETLGEVNKAAGHLAPWHGTFIPQAWTAPVNRGVHWAQRGAVTAYIFVFREVNLGLDRAIDVGEAAESEVVAGCIYVGHEVALGTRHLWSGGQAAWGGVTGLFLQR